MKKVGKDIFYIGVNDRDLDLFESQYEVPEGMAYNSYLIVDEKIAIMDTVDGRRAGEWVENLREALGDRQPDYLVVHHMEPDHSALIAWAMAEYPSLTLVASNRAVSMLPQFFGDPENEVVNLFRGCCHGEGRCHDGDGVEEDGRCGCEDGREEHGGGDGRCCGRHGQGCHKMAAEDLAARSIAVKEGDTLPLGEHTLKFLMAPMVHWPEVMVSFDEASGTLFSADAFGKFGVLDPAFWGDEEEDWACEARRYYFNICGKYGVQVQMLLKKLAALPVNMICPLHGPVLRRDLGQYIGLYQTWSSYAPETEGVLIAYASIHGGTAVVALCLAALLEARGVRVAIQDLTRTDIAEAVEDAFRYSHMVVAACSYDAGLFPPAYNFLHKLQIKGYQNRSVALIENGSWAPTAARVMTDMLAPMKNITLIGSAITIRSRLRSSDLPALIALADTLAGDLAKE